MKRGRVVAYFVLLLPKYTKRDNRSIHDF